MYLGEKVKVGKIRGPNLAAWGRYIHRILNRKSDWNKLLQTSTHKCEFNTTQTGYEDVNWVHLGLYRYQ